VRRGVNQRQTDFKRQAKKEAMILERVCIILEIIQTKEKLSKEIFNKIFLSKSLMKV
jgi:hypothetical protein